MDTVEKGKARSARVFCFWSKFTARRSPGMTAASLFAHAWAPSLPLSSLASTWSRRRSLAPVAVFRLFAAVFCEISHIRARSRIQAYDSACFVRFFVCVRAPRSRVAVVQFRLYQDGDFARLYAIEEFCFQPPIRFGRGTMRPLVDSSVCATWIAEEDDAILGFAIVEWTREPDLITAYIPTLEVLPDQRRRGIGAELLRRVEASATAAGAGLIWLHVDA